MSSCHVFREAIPLKAEITNVPNFLYDSQIETNTIQK